MDPIKIDLDKILINDISSAREIILKNGVGVYRLNISKDELLNKINKAKKRSKLFVKYSFCI